MFFVCKRRRTQDARSEFSANANTLARLAGGGNVADACMVWLYTYPVAGGRGRVGSVRPTLSRGILSDSSPANLSACARQRHLIRWHTAAAVKNTPRSISCHPPSTDTFDLFTDATDSPAGGRSVLIDRPYTHRYRRFSLGNPSPQHQRRRAPRYHYHLRLFRPSSLPSLVDNTSALVAFPRGFAHSHALNAEISHYLRTLPYTQSMRSTSPLRRTRQTCRAGRPRTKRNERERRKRQQTERERERDLLLLLLRPNRKMVEGLHPLAYLASSRMYDQKNKRERERDVVGFVWSPSILTPFLFFNPWYIFLLIYTKKLNTSGANL
eukprot:gene9790-6867_t